MAPALDLRQQALERFLEEPEDTGSRLRTLIRADLLGEREESRTSFARLFYEGIDEERKDTDPLAQIHEGRYYPVGLSRQITSLRDHIVPTADFIALIEELMYPASTRPTTIVLANLHTNIFALLCKRHPDEAKEVLEAEARKRAHLIGERYKLFIEAIQDCKQKRDQKTYVRRPIVLMSELTNTPEFEELHLKVFNLVKQSIESDCTLAQAMYDLVPQGLKKSLMKANKDQTLQEMNDEAKLKALNLILYVIYQIAIVLFLRGIKLGHEGENAYNEITDQIAELLGIETAKKPKYQTLQIENPTGRVPYRGTAIVPSMKAERGASLATPFRKTRRTLEETDEFLAAKLSYNADALRRTMDTIMDRVDRTKEELKHRHEEMMEIYTCFIEKLEQTTRLTQEQKQEILRAETIRIIHEMALSLSSNESIKRMFKDSGLLKVLKRKKDVSSLYNPQEFSFECARRENESDEAYLARYFGEIIQGTQGPIYINPDKQLFTVGIDFWVMANKLYKGLTGQDFAQRHIREFKKNTGWRNKEDWIWGCPYTAPNRDRLRRSY